MAFRLIGAAIDFARCLFFDKRVNLHFHVASWRSRSCIIGFMPNENTAEMLILNSAIDAIVVLEYEAPLGELRNLLSFQMKIRHLD